MDCPGCSHANREGAIFCAQCATPLPVACASCGSELSAQARFCDQCGTPVAAAAGPADPADSATRKVVTVLFGDLVGSTSFGERVDAESAREAMAEYHAMATDAIESNGGTVAKFIGDGVMALFGVPETAEDDADRAVAAGLALQRGFEPIRDRVEHRHSAELGLRVGINTGEIVLADGDADLVGDAINTAARIEAACTPGHVLVGEETWRLTRARVNYEVLGEVSVKGKDDAVATFQVADDAVHADDDQATPFVGRSDELATLRDMFGTAVGTRSARLATVIGAPGVGKTRIAREFGQSLGDEVTVVELRCERAGTATFAPVADLLRSIVNIDDTTTAEEARGSLRELVAELPDADRVADLLASFVGAAPARSTEEAFLAVRRLVEASGRRQPLVLVVDDIQWAEPLFLDLLEHLADWVSDAPAVLLCLARPELRDLRPGLALVGRTVSASLSLEGLDAAETALLAARLVGAESLPPELIERLPTSTEGNPLFVRELMRMLVDDGVIEETDGGWELTIDAEAVEVPPTIQSLLAARLDRMPADERRLVELAAVVGPEFALGAVAEISDGLSAADLRVALDRLRRRELVEPTGMYWGDEPIYRFHHVLIRDAAYRRLLKRARADLHLKVGEWTERTATHLAGEHEVAIAYHFEQAHEYHRQLDDVDEAIAAVGRHASELFGTAGERALERDDLAAASALAERALARLDAGDALVSPMLVVAAEALLGLGDVARGRQYVERLSAVASGDERLAPWAEAFDAQLIMLTEPDRLNDAESRSDQAAAQLTDLGDEAGVAKARLVRAGALARLGRVGECEAELDRALTAARSADDRRRVAAVLGAAPLAALWGPSPIPRAGGRCLDVIRLLRITTGSPAVEATSVRCQAVLEALRGRFDTARTMLADSRATVEELGLRQALGETDMFTGVVELLAGEPAAAEPRLRAAYEGLRRLGIDSDAGHAAAYLARAVLALGRVDEAERLAAESAELAGENPQIAIAAGSAQAEILAAQGRHDDAVASASAAVARAEGTDIIVDHAAASAVLAQVAGLAGDTATAERAARVASDLYEQKAATVAAVAPSPTSGARPSSLPPAEPNRAARLSSAWVPLWLSDEDEFFRRMTDDVLLLDRRSLAGSEVRGREAARAAFGDVDPHRRGRVDIAPVATRGDDLVLFTYALVFGGEQDGVSVECLELNRWTADDRVDLTMTFDVDDLDEAMAELEGRHREGAAAGGREPWNEADRLARRFVDLFTAGARDEWLPMISPDQVTRDQRPLVGVDADGADALAEAYPRDEDTRAMTSDVETIAVRGENLALIRWRATSGSGRVWDDYHLTRWSPDGLNELNVIFPPDQLAGAIDELIRLYLADESDIERAWRAREAAKMMRRLGAGDIDGAMRQYDASFVLVDHRQLGWPELDRAGFRERLSTFAQLGAEVVVFVERMLHTNAVGARAVQRNVFRMPDGTEQITRSAGVTLFDPQTNLISRMEQFDEDAIEDAQARYDELLADRGPVLRNTASTCAAVMNSWLRDEAGGPPSNVVADHVEFIDEHGERYGPEPVDRRLVLAVRDEQLALVALADDEQVPFAFTVEEVDDDGRLSSVRRFGVDGLRGAIDELDRRWLELLDGANDTDRLVNDLSAAWRSRDVERLDQIVGDDFVLVDHRPVSLPEMDKRTHIAMISDLAASGDLGIGTGAWTERNDRGVSMPSVVVGRDIDGRLVESLQSISVCIVDGGEVVRIELFPIDEREAATARFRELTGVAPAVAPPEHEPWNEADRVLRELLARVLSSSLGDWTEFLHADFTSTDRRPLVGSGTLSRDEFVELWAGQQVAPGHTAELSTVAARGDDLVLLRVTVETEGSVSDYLYLCRCRDGFIDITFSFEPDQLGEAVDELDRLHLESIDPSSMEAFFVRGFGSTYGALRDGDVDRAMRLISERYVQHDHRGIGFPSVDWAGMRERLSTMLTGNPPTPIVTRVLRLVDVVLLCQSEVRIIGEHGQEQVDQHLFVAIADPTTAVMVHMDQFALDQIDDAVARFEQAVAEQAVQEHRWNNASLTGGLLALADRLGRDDFTAGLVADGFDRTVSGDAAAVRRVLAVRDDRLALVALLDADEVPLGLVVEELDDSGRLVAVYEFAGDDLRSAAAQLDQRWLATVDDPSESDRVVIEWLSAWRERDVTRLASVLDDDFRGSDRRPLVATVSLDKSEQIAAHLSLADSGDVPLPVDLLMRNEQGLVASFAIVGYDADARLTESLVSTAVSIVRNERVWLTEAFGDRQTAIARFHELTADAPPTLHEHAPWNDADRMAREYAARFTARDDDSWMSMLAPDFEMHDRRPVVGYDGVGIDQILAMWPDVDGENAAVHVETIAARGRQLVLQRWTGTRDDITSEWDALHLTRLNPDGKADLHIVYPREMLGDAVRELTELYIAGDADRDLAWQLREFGRGMRLLNQGDVESTMRLYDPSFVMLDHRQLGWPDLDRDTMRERLETFATLGSDVIVFAEQLLRQDSGFGSCAAQRNVFRSADGTEQITRSVAVTVFDPHTMLLSRIEQFDEDAVDEAIARYDELLAERGRVLSNEASTCAGFVNAWLRHGDDELLAEAIADGAEFLDEQGEPFELRAVGRRRVMAVREDRFAMVELFDEATGFHRIAVEEIDGNGRLCAVTLFGVDQIDAARDLFHRRHHSSVGGAVAEMYGVVGTILGAFARGDSAAAEPLFDVAFEYVDHRRLGNPSMDRGAYSAAFETMASVGGAFVTAEILRETEHGLVSGSSRWTLSDDGHLTEDSPAIRLAMVDDGRCSRLELFEIDDVDAALARFDELAAAAVSAGHQSWNEADRLTRTFISRFAEGNVDRWAELFADDLVVIDRTPLVGFDSVSGEQLTEMWQDFDAAGLSSNVETVAARGESLVLVRWRAERTGSSATWDSYMVMRWNAQGVNDLAVRFPPDMLAEAVAELGRLYQDELGGSFEALALSEIARGIEYVSAGEVDSFMELHDPAFVMRDHRQLGWAELSLDAYRQFLESITSLGRDAIVITERVLRLDPTSSTCTAQRLVFTSPDGAQDLIRSVGLMIVDPATGLIAAIEFFDEDQVDEAVARFDELMAERGPVLNNEASQRAAYINSWVRRGDEELLATAIALDAEFIDEQGEPFELTSVERREAMAVRGDRLALVNVSGPGHSFRVEEIDSGGRLAGVRRFEPADLNGAVAYLDERWFAEAVATYDGRFILRRADDGGGLVALVTDSSGRATDTTDFAADEETAARQHLVTAWVETLNPRRQQVAAIAQSLGEAWVAPSTHPFDDLLAAGFEMVDGRTLGMGALDRDAFEVALRGREADGMTGRPMPSRVEFVSDDVMVFRANNLGHAPGSGIDWEEIACNVLVVDGDRITRLEMFDEDHWSDAWTRANELAGS